MRSKQPQLQAGDAVVITGGARGNRHIAVALAAETKCHYLLAAVPRLPHCHPVPRRWRKLPSKSIISNSSERLTPKEEGSRPFHLLQCCNLCHIEAAGGLELRCRRCS